VIYNAIDTERYRPMKSFVDADNKKPYILYVAKMAPHKNQLILLKAFKILIEKGYDINLVLVGPKRAGFTSAKVSEYYKECRDFINTNNLSKSVIFKEDVSQEDLIGIYQNAEVFVHPSIEEGFGLVLLEAMSCGLSCVVNNIKPLTEVIGDAGILSDGNDPKRLAEDIEKLINDENLRMILGKKARERAEKLFSWNIIGEQIDSVLSYIIADKKMKK